MLPSLKPFLVGLALYLGLCFLSLLAGRGLARLFRLHLAGLRSDALAPVLTLVFWSLVLGIATACGVAIATLAPWLWGATALLALLGARRPWPALWPTAFVLLLCAVLPTLVLGPQLRAGIHEVTTTIRLDGWEYITAGNYRFHGTTTSTLLSPFNWLGSRTGYFVDFRYMSYVFLAFFSPLVRAGDTLAVSALFQAWSLFTFGCAVGFCAAAHRQRAWTTAAIVSCSLLGGWIADLIYANNFDNTLAITYMPALVGLVRVPRLRRRGREWLIAALAAAAVYTFPEGAPFIFAGTVLLSAPWLLRQRRRWADWARGAAATAAIAGLLLAPLAVLTPILKKQLFISAQLTKVAPEARPGAGSGYFDGLLTPAVNPAALWGLGGENPFKAHTPLLNVWGILLTALLAIGLVRAARLRSWGLVLTVPLLAACVAYSLLHLHYGYPAYKFLVLYWWCLAWLLVLGAVGLLQAVPAPRWRVVAGIPMLAFALLVYRHAAEPIRHPSFVSPSAGLRASQFRGLRSLKKVLPEHPIVIAVDDWLANLLAVYQTRDLPGCVVQHRWQNDGPAIQAHAETMPSPVHGTCYVLTDQQIEARLPPLRPAAPVWSTGPYKVWLLQEEKGDVMVVDFHGPNGLEAYQGEPFFWIGAEPTTLTLVSSGEGIAHLEGIFVPGPSGEESPVRKLLLSTDAGFQRSCQVTEGEGSLEIPLRAGRNVLQLRGLDRPSRSRLPNGDPRTLLLGIKGLKIARRTAQALQSAATPAQLPGQ